ncbi:MAG: glycosyltransferase family 2 protein [Verrucomicrobia bacterium]|nr:glycosyltransferase family 2 protein [Verrucomicrobiota bacterium]
MSADLSLIIPFFNEEENVSAVIAEARTAVPGAEMIAVDDGSCDRTPALLKQEKGIHVIHFSKNLGQGPALYAGLLAATRPYAAMMDGDGQNDPADLPALLDLIRTGKADFACGIRTPRRDSWQKRVASKIANAIRRSVLLDGAHDTGCSLKVIKREDVRFLVPFKGMHRYLPALLGAAGLKLGEKPVRHRPRRAGVSKYTIAGRAWVGIQDLIGVSWLLRRRVPWPAGLPGPSR